MISTSLLIMWIQINISHKTQHSSNSQQNRTYEHFKLSFIFKQVALNQERNFAKLTADFNCLNYTQLYLPNFLVNQFQFFPELQKLQQITEPMKLLSIYFFVILEPLRQIGTCNMAGCQYYKILEFQRLDLIHKIKQNKK